MKKLFVSVALAALASAALASPPGHAGNPHNGGTAVAVGVGVGIAGAEATSVSGASANNSFEQTQSLFSGATSYGGDDQANMNLQGASIGNSSVAISIPKQAPAVSGVNIPGTIGSCRMYVSLFGSSAGGAGGGGIPLWNDTTCLVGAKLRAMVSVNEIAPDTYTRNDFVRVACELDGMGATDGCKKLSRQASVAPSTNVASAGQPIAP